MKKIFLLVSFLVFGFGFGQNLNPADRDPSFNQLELPLGHFFHDVSNVTKTQTLSDGKLLVLAGYKSQTVGRLVKMDNTILDTSFNCDQINIRDFIVQPDGKIILIVGTYTFIGGAFYDIDKLVRINNDGTIDSTFTSGTGTAIINSNSSINSICLQTDGKIILSGLFNSFNDYPTTNFLRLNENGSVDNSFNNTSIAAIKPLKIVLQENQKILVFNGVVNSINSNNDCKVYRLNEDGIIDTTFGSGVGFSFGFSSNLELSIKSVTIQSDDKIIVCGNFGKYNGNSSSGIARINSDGSYDTSFQIGSGFLSSSQQFITPQFGYTVLLQPDGKILVGGEFTSFNGVEAKKIIRINTDGSRDDSFIAVVGCSTINEINGPYVINLSLDNNGKIICGGSFSIFNNTAAFRIVKLNNDGSIDSSFNNICKGFDDDVSFTLTQPDNKILVFGNFKSYNGFTRDQIVRLNTDGTIDTTFVCGPSLGNFSSNIYDAVIQSDGKIIVGLKAIAPANASFVNGYQSDGSLIRLNPDGSKDLTFNPSQQGLQAETISLAIQSDGKILVSGRLYYYNGVAAAALIRLNPNGSLDASYNVGVPYYATDKVVVQPDGKILLVLGYFGISPTNFKLIRLLNTFQIDPSFTIDATISSSSSPKIQFDGKILIINPITNKLVRINTNGSLDTSFIFPANLYTMPKSPIETLSDGKILMCITDYQKIIKLNYNGSIDVSFEVGDGFDNFFGYTRVVTSIKEQSDGKILVCGLFKKYRGLSERGIVRLSGEKHYIFQGHSSYDFDENGCDLNDFMYPNLNMVINNGSSNVNYFANGTGNFFVALPIGVSTLTPTFENSNYFSFSPPSVTLDFPNQSSPVFQNFCIVPNGEHPDLEVFVIPVSPARPGFEAIYKILYKNKGNKLQSGLIEFQFNSAISQFQYSFPNPINTITNALIWDFDNLYPFEQREIYLYLLLNSPQQSPPLSTGDLLHYFANINSPFTDETPSNNYFYLVQPVLNSFDPNDKNCLEGSTIETTKVGDYVHYMIRFENTGTYSAQNITVKDVIDTNKYDINSIVPFSGSHPFITRVLDGNRIEFLFENINLPFADATNDGYVAFKIKTKSTLLAGDSFSNSAGIYFDYNYPITTNTATTTITALSNQDFTFNDYFSVYPNPVENNLYISKKVEIEISSITIYNMLGQIVVAIPNAKNIENIDVSELKTGNYFVKINSDKGTSNTKFIKL